MSKNKNEVQAKNNNVNDKFQELQVQMNEMIAMQQAQLNKEIISLKEQQEKQNEKISIVQQEHENARDLEIKRHRVKEHRYGFVGLSDLGQSYEVSIGAKTMGKLLRVVGLAKRNKRRTEPMRSATLNDYAKSMMYGDFPTYQWNPEKVIEKIDRWLDKHEIIDEFYSIDNEKDLQEYISELHDKFGE